MIFTTYLLHAWHVSASVNISHKTSQTSQQQLYNSTAYQGGTHCMEEKFVLQPSPVCSCDCWEVPGHAESWNSVLLFRCKFFFIKLESMLKRYFHKKSMSICMLTSFMIFLMCRSGQSSITTVATSGSPLKSTWITAGLNPVTRGPSCRKLWANILPATLKRLLSMSASDAAGTRWSGSPSNNSVRPIPPVKYQQSRNHSNY